MVKLIEPVDEHSPTFPFAKKGGRLHHLCFNTGGLTIEIDRLPDLSLRVIAGPELRETFQNEDIAFLFARQGLNIELIDTDKRVGRCAAD